MLDRLRIRTDDRRIIRAVAAAGRPLWWTPPALVALGSFAALTEGLGIGLLIPLISVIFGQSSGSETINAFVGWLGTSFGDEQMAVVLSFFILLLAALRAAVVWAYEAMAIWASGKVVHALRTALARQLLDVGYVYYLNRDRGWLLDVLRSETWRVSEFLLGIARILISICAIAVLGLFLIMISAPMTLGAAAGAVGIALVVRLMALRAQRRGQQMFDEGAALSRCTSQMLSAMRTIRLFGQEDRQHEDFSRLSERLRKASQRVERTAAAIHPLTELLYTPLFLGVFLAAWVMGTAFPTLIGFLVLLYRIQPHARALDRLRVEVASHSPAVRQMAELVEPADKPYVVSGQRQFSRLSKAIDFDSVSFSYGGEAGEDCRAVSDLTFRISCKQITAIVGESGAGKSTIVNLMFRLYDPTSGRIYVDGVPLDEVCLSDWRRQLAFAGQDTELIGDTVFEVISFGRPSANMAEVERAAEQANATEFIVRLPQGFRTQIGPDGVRLSAGQRQRLGLARALLCEPEVLVLDEATNALDSLSENLILSALNRLRGSLTIVVIAHRLSSIRDADTVIVMQDGRVAEQGAPGELLRRSDGAFAELWRAQRAQSSRASA